MKKIILAFILIVLAIAIYADDDWGNPPGDGIAPSPDGSTDNSNQDTNSQSTTNTQDGSSLDITSISISPSGPNPGEEVTVKVKIKNNAEEKIEDIDLIIDLDGLENDNGNEIDDDANFDLSQGKYKEVKFNFIMPYEVDDGDTYKINVNVKGNGKDTGEDYEDSNSDEEIKFSKKNHELAITGLSASPQILSCSNALEIEYNIINTGKNDEKADIIITSPELGIDYKNSIEIAESDNYQESKKFKANLNAETYNIELNVNYGSYKETKSIEVKINDCKAATTNILEEQISEEPVKEEQIKEEKTDEIVTKIYSTPMPLITENNVEPNPITARAVQNVKFTDTDEYIFLLTIVFIIMLGLVIYAIGAVIILLKR